MSMTTTLREMIGRVDAATVGAYQQCGVLSASVVATGRDGESVIAHVHPELSRDDAMAAIREGLEMIDATSVVFTDEAWRFAGTPGDGELVQAYMAEHGTMEGCPVPGVEDVVVYYAESETEGSTHAERVITNGVLGPLMFVEYDSVEGNLTGLLPRRGRVQ